MSLYIVAKTQLHNKKNRADPRLAPSQWETALQSNAVSHWLGKPHFTNALWANKTNLVKLCVGLTWNTITIRGYNATHGTTAEVPWHVLSNMRPGWNRRSKSRLQFSQKFNNEPFVTRVSGVLCSHVVVILHYPEYRGQNPHCQLLPPIFTRHIS